MGLGRPIGEVPSWLRPMDPDLVVRDPLVLAHALGISLHVPDLDDGPEARVQSAGAFVRWTTT